MSTSPRAHFRVGTALISAALTACVLVAFPATSQADEVTVQEVEEAFHKAEAANEKLNAINADIDAAEAEIAAIKKDQVDIEARYEKSREALASVIVQQQMDAPLGPTVNLLGSKDPEEFLDGLSAVQAYNSSQADLLEEFGEVAAAYQARQDHLANQVADLKQTKKKAAAKKAEVQEAADEAQAAFDQLSADDQETFRTEGGTASRSAPRPPKVNGAVAQAVVSFAYAQLGKAYCYGGTGPSCFDCSGLAMKAYAAAGVSIPRTPPYGNTIPLSQIQPGDILWTYSHVAIYIGGGQYIEAANPSVPVRVGSLNGGWFKPSYASRFG